MEAEGKFDDGTNPSAPFESSEQPPYPPPAAYPEPQVPPYPTQDAQRGSNVPPQSEVPYGGQPPPPAEPQEAYPPPQSDFYPQQAGAAYPQQSAYPPPEAYPSQPPPEYPSQPPPYQHQGPGYPPQAIPPEQKATHVVVVQQQPTAMPYVVHTQSNYGQGALYLAIMTTMCFLFCGCWWSLICSGIAIVFACNAQSNAVAGDMAGAKSNQTISYICTVVSMVFAVLATVASVVIVVIRIQSLNNDINNSNSNSF